MNLEEIALGDAGHKSISLLKNKVEMVTFEVMKNITKDTK